MSAEERIKARIAARQALGLSADEMQAKEIADAKYRSRRLRELCQLIIQATVAGNQQQADAYHREYKGLGGK